MPAGAHSCVLGLKPAATPRWPFGMCELRINTQFRLKAKSQRFPGVLLQKILTLLIHETRDSESACTGVVIDAHDLGQHYIVEVQTPEIFKGLRVFSSFMDLKKVKELATYAMRNGSYQGPTITSKQFENGDRVSFKVRLSLQGIDLEKCQEKFKKTG